MTSAVPVPPSPSSPSSASSSVSGSPPALDPNTLALLNSFIASKTDEERRFNELAEEAAARVAGLDLEFDYSEQEEETQQKRMLTVDEYRVAFSEDWQLSQFWYTTAFAMRFARLLHTLCTPQTSIAFLCCPTAFVAFEHTKPRRNARLLEIDGRFSVLTPKYIPYDMEEPTALPAYLAGSVDIAVVDPPFLNEYTNTHVVTTLRQIMRPEGSKLVVLTSTSVAPVLEKLYDSPPLGPLRRTKVKVLHGQLRNDFGCWASWEGSEDLELGEEGDDVGTEN